MRKCKECGEEKKLELFRKIQIWRSHTCKACYAAQYRTGKPNAGRFKKGQESLWKGKKRPSPRTEPRYKKKGRPIKWTQARRNLWALEVKKRDNNECQICKSKKNIHAHHIIRWKEDGSKRFDLDNGISLCCSCHCRAERLIEMKKRAI